MTSGVDIIIPTYDNLQMLAPCVNSILNNSSLVNKIIVVNNGKEPIEQYIKSGERIVVLKPKDNLGWEGGLALGLENSKSPFVCFLNDDTFFPVISCDWLTNLLLPFANSNVGAVGPVSNVVAGLQNIFHPNAPSNPTEVSYLIGFCMMVRREALDKAGGIDTALPGGDDFDLSIRLRKAGYMLVVQPQAFVYHHGFVTGTRLHGDHTKKGGWNSKEMTDRTNQALIQKHGFRTFMQTVSGLSYGKKEEIQSDLEGDLIRSLVKGGKIVELGCGDTKTIADSIGVDIVPKGDLIPGLESIRYSVADITADITKELPFEDGSVDCIIARHVLEHCLDAVKTLKEWRRVLKEDGKLILALPNHGIANTIPLNPQHVHAFTPESLKSLLRQTGFYCVDNFDSKNGISFVTQAKREKVEAYAGFTG